jgi:hypothetical protein
MPIAPEFRYLEGDTAAASVSARLVANPYEPNALHELGSSIRIAKNLYVTAKHVIEDYLQTFGRMNGTANFVFWAVHVEPGPQYSIWEVDRCWFSPCADLAVFHSRAYNDIATNNSHPTCVGMSIAPPRVGERVAAFGYERRTPRLSCARMGPNTLSWRANHPPQWGRLSKFTSTVVTLLISVIRASELTARCQAV